MRIKFIHLELWVAVAKHNFKWVKIQIIQFSAWWVGGLVKLKKSKKWIGQTLTTHPLSIFFLNMYKKTHTKKSEFGIDPLTHFFSHFYIFFTWQDP